MTAPMCLVFVGDVAVGIFNLLNGGGRKNVIFDMIESQVSIDRQLAAQRSHFPSELETSFCSFPTPDQKGAASATPSRAESDSRRERPVEEICGIFERHTSARIIFIVVLKNGRLTGRDSVTVNTVLDEIKVDAGGGKFGVLGSFFSANGEKGYLKNLSTGAEVGKHLDRKCRAADWSYVVPHEEVEGNDIPMDYALTLSEFFTFLLDINPQRARNVVRDATGEARKSTEFARELICIRDAGRGAVVKMKGVEKRLVEFEKRLGNLESNHEDGDVLRTRADMELLPGGAKNAQEESMGAPRHASESTRSKLAGLLCTRGRFRRAGAA